MSDTKTKKSPYLPFLIIVFVFLIAVYAIDVFTSKYIILAGTNEEYQELVDINTENAESLINVNYSTLISFLENDTIDENEYIEYSYICIDFTLDLLHSASLENIRSGLVILDYHTVCGHAISCFETTDLGVIFIEPQSDNDVTDEIIILNEYISNNIYTIATFWN